MSQVLGTLALLLWATSSGGQAPPAHAKTYWQAIANSSFSVPAGTTAAALAPELVSNLGSPDPELRDALSFSILTAWIYQQKRLGPDDLRPMIRTLRDNLHVASAGQVRTTSFAVLFQR